MTRTRGNVSGSEKNENEKKNILMMPDQFEVVSLGELMKEIFERDFREHCQELGIDPDSIKPIG